jgi:hypothetical protein
MLVLPATLGLIDLEPAPDAADRRPVAKDQQLTLSA